MPGCLDPLFRGQIPDGVDPRSLMQVEPLGDHPEYQDRETRIRAACFPTRKTVELVTVKPHS